MEMEWNGDGLSTCPHAHMPTTMPTTIPTTMPTFMPTPTTILHMLMATPPHVHARARAHTLYSLYSFCFASRTAFW